MTLPPGQHATDGFPRFGTHFAVPPPAVPAHPVIKIAGAVTAPFAIEDVLADDVLIAEHLDGRPLDGDHGAPVRLVSASQYGFVSIKHLCRIEVHTARPPERYVPDRATRLGLRLVKPHRRARVWEEERHGHLPAWAVRPVYRLLIPPIKYLSARSARSSPGAAAATATGPRARPRARGSGTS